MKSFAVDRYVRIPGSLGSVLFANPRSEWYIQRKNGARCGGSEYFSESTRYQVRMVHVYR